MRQGLYARALRAVLAEVDKVKLRPYQLDAVDRARRAIRTGKRHVALLLEARPPVSWCGFLCRCGCGQECSCGSPPIVRKVGFSELEDKHGGKVTVVVDLFEDGSEAPHDHDWVADHVRLAGDLPLAAVHPAPRRSPPGCSVGLAPVVCGVDGCRFALGHYCAHEVAAP